MTNELSSSLSCESVNIEFYHELLSNLPVHLEISFEVSSSSLLKRANQTYCHHPHRRTTVEGRTGSANPGTSVYNLGTLRLHHLHLAFQSHPPSLPVLHICGICPLSLRCTSAQTFGLLRSASPSVLPRFRNLFNSQP
jgi:hypothetical protein